MVTVSSSSGFSPSVSVGDRISAEHRHTRHLRGIYLERDDRHPAARPQDAEELGERRALVGCVLESVDTHRRVDRAVGKVRMLEGAPAETGAAGQASGTA